jgi:putative SOS response-associated peptidase YedK
MCFFHGQDQPLKKVQERFDAIVDHPDDFLVSDYVNGFEHSNVPIIINKTPNIISTNYHWGLVPHWAKDLDIRKNTLNARIETVEEKPSFRDVTQNRCLIIASSFFEWRWLDEKGKQKEKYQIFSNNSESFAFAGIYSTWTNPITKEQYNSYSMVTTAANENMSYIHNHKLRMPVLLNKGDENFWLDNKNAIQEFAYPNYKPNLIGFKI